MADIKIDDSSSIASGDYADDKLREWNVNLELDFLTAVARCKPVGIHKHFRIISIQRQFNRASQTHYSLQDIRERLSAYYDMNALEELDKEDEEEAEEEAAAAAADDSVENQTHEFSLPLDEYEQLISEHRKDDEAEMSPSPSPPPTTMPTPTKKARTSIKRETSPMSSASATPTPEPEEAGKTSSRRSTRRKSDSRKKTPGTKNTGSGGVVSSSSSTNRRKRR
ncbi:chromatin modification-related protein EAF7-domain-containing protein [Dichotomocladium elegans]|nr:chromatin modification-related protein EAF7-domain-containing protein [Dichotomocladium elegans]